MLWYRSPVPACARRARRLLSILCQSIADTMV